MTVMYGYTEKVVKDCPHADRIFGFCDPLEHKEWRNKSAGNRSMSSSVAEQMIVRGDAPFRTLSKDIAGRMRMHIRIKNLEAKAKEMANA